VAEWSFVVGGNAAVSRYVKSLYDVAASMGNERQVGNWLESIKHNIVSVGNYKKFLRRMSLIKSDGLEFIRMLCQELKLPAELENFLTILLKNGKFSMILDVCDCYSAYLDKVDGKKLFFITFAKDVEKQMEEQLRTDLVEVFGGEINCIVSKDASLIDGFCIQHGSKILDYSMRSRLQRLSSAMRKDSHED
jgi:F-type H+-transporting ATPase subunit delta